MKLKNTKVCLFGIQGSGKTYLVEKALIKKFKKPVVYLMHEEDFQNSHKNMEIIIPKDEEGNVDTSMRTLNKLSKELKRRAINGEIDAFILDEADLFIRKDFRQLQKYSYFHDLLVNHRHYSLNLTFISRRPQELPTTITEQSEHVFVFAIDGKNVREYLTKIHKDYGRLLNYLSKDEHNFIYKTLGKPPKLYAKLNIK